jgi:hypothetical protein
MGLVILFGLVTILCAIAVLRELRTKNFLAVGLAGLTVLVFGWFTVMTFISLLSGGGSSH